MISILKIFVEVAGVGGVALFIAYRTYSALIKKATLSPISSRGSYKIIVLVICLTFVLIATTLGGWFIVINPAKVTPQANIETNDPATSQYLTVANLQAKIRTFTLNPDSPKVKLHFQGKKSWNYTGFDFEASKKMSVHDLKTALIKHFEPPVSNLYYNQRVVWWLTINEIQAKEGQNLEELKVKEKDIVSLGYYIQTAPTESSENVRPNYNTPNGTKFEQGQRQP
jgi:hypothetical protein